MKKNNRYESILTNLSIIAKPHCDQITDAVHKIVKLDLESLTKSHENYKQVFRIITMFSIRISHITNGILSLISLNNIYGAKILLRSLIDHTYKTVYITERALKDGNGTVADDYLIFCDFAEELQYQRALDYKSQILDDKIIDDEAFSDMLKRKPELNIYTKKQIFEKANQFTFSYIHKYLHNKDKIIKEDLENENLKKGFVAILHNATLYADLSSFVHGGPFAEISEFMLKFEEEKNDEEILDIIEYLMMLHFYANVSIAHFFSTLDKKHMDSVETITNSLLDYYEKI